MTVLRILPHFGPAILFAALLLLTHAMPQCQYEDGSWCRWDAQTQGNGEGDSFVALWPGFAIYVR